MASSNYPSFGPRVSRTNPWAVIAAALAFFPVLFPVVLIFGHVASGEIKRFDERGSGLAIFALVMGYLYLGIAAFLLVSVASRL